MCVWVYVCVDVCVSIYIFGDGGAVPHSMVYASVQQKKEYPWQSPLTEEGSRGLEIVC